MGSEGLPVVLVHTPPDEKADGTNNKRDRRKIGKHSLPKAQTLPEEKSQEKVDIKFKKNGKPSRRWLASEVEKVFEKNADLTKQLDLRREIERSLLETKMKLERELASLKSRRVTGATENQAIRERNKQLSQDVYLMKNILVKLNLELERYQDKVRKYERDFTKPEKLEEGDGPKYQDRGIKTIDWVNGEVTIFAPLLLAYEESLSEKNELIKEFRYEIEKISGKMKELVKENEELRQKIADSEKQGEITYSDWISLQKDLAVTVEQNQLLTRQVKLQHAKISELKSVFQSKLNEVSIERDDALDRVNHLKTDTSVLKGRFTSLQEEFSRTKEEANSRIPQSVHTAYLAECKRLLDELKARHTEEKDMLIRRLELAEINRPNLERDLASVLSEKDVLANKVAALSRELRTLEAKLSESEDKRHKMDKLKESLKDRVGALSIFSKDLMKEHELTIRQLSGGARLSLDLGARLEEIKNQVKKVEMDTLEQINLLDENITSQAARVDRLKSSHSLEVQKLQEALQVKEHELMQLRDEVKEKNRN